MNPWEEFGKMLLLLGGVLIGIGVLLLFGAKLPFFLGRLPGDIMIKRGNFTFYFPLTTCILLSLLLTLLFSIFFRR